MVKKLLYLISVVMIIFTGVMFRMRPGQMFKIIPSPNNKKTVSTSKASNSKKQRTVQRKSFDISEERKVFLLKYTGSIEVIRKGVSINIRRGMTLGFKDELITGPKTVAVLSFANNSSIKVFSNSNFVITKIQSRERSDINMQYNLFELKAGALLVDFVNQGNSHFLEITSPSSKLQVRGTQFLYLHNKAKKRSQLAVREGIVKVFGSSQRSKFVLEKQGILVKNNKELGEVTNSNWVKKINWTKLSVGSGIDLYDPYGSPKVKDEWKARRARLKRKSFTQVSKNIGNAASKTKTGGLLKSVVGKVLEVGGAIAEKGVKTMKSSSPLSQVGDAAEDVKNFEEEQKKKTEFLDSLDEN